jgi:predicted nucleic acid-binding protein
MRIVTTPSASDRVLVDSTGWVEYFANGPKAEAFAPYLESQGELLLPLIVVYEVYKKLLRERGHAAAEQFYSQALRFTENEIQLDAELAVHAARVSLATGLAMADAIIYATAQVHEAQLVTSDPHFSALPGVTVI